MVHHMNELKPLPKNVDLLFALQILVTMNGHTQASTKPSHRLDIPVAPTFQ